MKKKKFCESCGKEVNDNRFCPHCGEQVKKGNVMSIICYVIGTLFILVYLGDLPDICGFVGILFGLSFYPVIYQFISKKLKNKDMKIFRIVVPIILLILLGSVSPSDNSDIGNADKHSNDAVKSGKKEPTFIKDIKSELDDDDTLLSYKLDKDSNRYIIELEVTDSSYVSCVTETDYYARYARDHTSNKEIDYIKTRCVSNSETIGYVKIENIYEGSTDELKTTFFDKDNNIMDTDFTTLSEKEKQEYKDSCENLDYKEALRNPTNYQYKKAYWFGKIVQVVTKNDLYSVFRVDVTCEKYQYIDGYSCDDTIYVTYYGKDSFIEDDMIKMWGTMDGTETYKTVLGSSVTIPKFYAKYIELGT